MSCGWLAWDEFSKDVVECMLRKRQAKARAQPNT